jgi:hypothetical protein
MQSRKSLFEPKDIGDMFFRSVGFSTLHGVIAQKNANIILKNFLGW